MKHFKRFNEAEIPNPHAWRNKPAAEKETNVLDMVRGGDVNALEDFLHANEADLKRNVTMAAKFSAPGTRHQNNEIYDYVMDHYNDIIDMEAVAKWLKYDRSHRDYVATKSNGRDIDSEGNDWYGFDHPEDLGESFKHIKTFEGFTETEQIVVDKKVKDILGKIFNKEFKAKYTDLDSCKELVDEFIKGTTFKDLKDEKGVSEITLPRLLKKFDSKVKDTVLADITSHFKKLNGGDAQVIIKK
jgi:hypothetical protein